MYHRGTIVVPVSLFMEVIEHIHRFQHAGVEKTIELFRRRYSVDLSETDIRKNVINMRKNCAICGATTAKAGKRCDRLVHQPVPPYIFSSLCMDFVDLPAVRFEKQRYDYALVVVCRLSGYVIALPCEKDGLTGEKVASMFFRNVLSFAGLPKEVTSDVDIRLMSTFFQTICQLSGV